MTEQQQGRRALEVGSTGKTVAANLARHRSRCRLTTRQLSSALERAGHPIPASGITRMEKGQRVVTADDLVALAVVLKVNPSALLFPPDDSPSTVVELLPGRAPDGGEVAATAWRLWDWADGQQPLFGHPDEEKDIQELLDFLRYARPSRRGRDEMMQALQNFRRAADEGGVDG